MGAPGIRERRLVCWDASLREPRTATPAGQPAGGLRGSDGQARGARTRHEAFPQKVRLQIKGIAGRSRAWLRGGLRSPLRALLAGRRSLFDKGLIEHAFAVEAVDPSFEGGSTNEDGVRCRRSAPHHPCERLLRVGFEAESLLRQAWRPSVLLDRDEIRYELQRKPVDRVGLV